MVIICYVDDGGISSICKDNVDKLLSRLQKRGFELTRDGSFSEYLGVKVTKDDKAGTITMTQQGLIQKILNATGMTHCHPNWTPATQLALGTDPDGPPMQDPWSYSSVIGMLLYLATNSRPDIAFAVSQVARFGSSPRQTHATAVKTIVRYIYRTIDKGIVMRPTGTPQVDCYVDADFAGLYKRETDDNVNSARSRTGYMIMLGNCPLVWKSQLQSEITLSTLEAEYSVLSSSMRMVLTIKRLLVDICEVITLPRQIHTSFRCRVFEDNKGALALATTHRITSRTKYFLVKWHWFWCHVKNGLVEVIKVDTTDQIADYLTKGLPRETFEKLRKLAQGW